MIRIAFPTSGLTPDISILNTSAVVVSSGEMTEVGPSNLPGYFWYEYSYTGTPGESYHVSVDAGVTITDPEIRYFDEWITEEYIPLEATDYVAPDNAGIAGIKTKTDNLPITPASSSDIPSASTIASAVRTNLTTELARIDANISSRMGKFTYTAPDNTSISAIKTKTDQMQFTTNNLHVVAKVVEDKTGYTLTPAQVSAIAVAVEQAILNEGDGNMILEAIVGAIGNTNVNQVALVAAIRADIERNGGMLEGKASQTSVNSIPTNPVLTTDSRLSNLDATISSRATPNDVDVNVTVDGGFSQTDRTTLEAIPTLTEIETGTKMTTIEQKVVLLERMQRGTMRISGTQIILEDSEGEIQRWNLLDVNGQPTSSVPYKREKIG